MSLIILMVRPLITQLAFCMWIIRIKEFDQIVRKLLLFLQLVVLFVVGLAYLLGVPVLGLVLEWT